MTQKTENNRQVKVPAKTESRVIEVSLKQVLGGLIILGSGIFFTSTGILLVREQARYKRQQAFFKSALELIQTFKPGKE